MYLLDFSKRVSDFIDAADDHGNIKNSKQELQYLNQIDHACKKAGITVGAVYPFSGGTGFSHKFNFLNPSKYLIDWHGGITHNHLGIQGDGVNGYGNTGIIPSEIAELNNAHMSIYSSSNDGNGVEIGIDSASSVFRIAISYQGNYVTEVNNAFSGAIGTNNNGANAMYICSRLSSTSYSFYRNGTLISNREMPSGTINSEYEIYLLAQNFVSTGAGFFSNNVLSFASIGTGLMAQQAKAFSHDVFVAQRSIERT